MDKENKYFTWNNEQLRQELKKRGLRTTGKKKNLQDRLIFADENKDFFQLHQQDPDAVFWTPENSQYKDINASTKIPIITKKRVQLFLQRYNVLKNLGKEMYENQYLLHARIALGNNSTFIQGHCLAQMKKSVQYKCDIEISSTGFIEGTHCECAVGGGDTAHCKHIAVLLWAIEEMGRDKKMTLRSVCTQKLQSFHKPAKSFFGSPIKAELLPKRNRDILPASDTVVLDPSVVDKQSYCEKQRNRAINFAATYQTTMPYLRLFEPANTYCAIWDHNYTNVNPEERLLNELKLLSVTGEDIKVIEEETREQAQCKSWFHYRRNRITASNFYRCCIIRVDEAQIELANTLLNQQPFKSKSTDWGIENESKALKIYESSTGVKVDKCGFFVSLSHPFLGASPDGLIGNDTVVEVKCPYSRRLCTIDEKTLPYLYLDQDNNLNLKKNHVYYYQIQGQLFVTGRLIAKFVVFTTVETVVITIHRDEEIIKLMVQRLQDFYDNYFRAAILDLYLYKRYSTIFKK